MTLHQPDEAPRGLIKGDKVEHPKYGTSEVVGRIQPTIYAKIEDEYVYIKPDEPQEQWADVLIVEEKSCIKI